MTNFFEHKCTLFTGIIGIGTIVLLKYFYDIWKSNNVLKILKNKHVIITGGSSGIGLALAKLAYRYGANVTIISRSSVNLINAKKVIENEKCLSSEGLVNYLAVDLKIDYNSLKEQVKSVIGETDILINCAGGAVARTFCDINPADIDDQMRLNYLSAANLTRILLPSMMKSKERKQIVFVSSMAGQVGIYGFGAYSASKFALRGLSECLQSEVSKYGISVTLAFPPDTQTPGFDNEQIGKPDVTKKLSSAGGLISADVVAIAIMKSALKGQFFSSLGFDGWLLTQLTQGMCLPESIGDFLSLVFLAPIWRLVAIGYGLWIRFTVYMNS